MGVFDRAKGWLKRLAARLMRPGLQDVYVRLDRLQDDVAACARGVSRGGAGSASKYEGEMAFWRKLIKEGMDVEKFGKPFEALFGQWQRDRLLQLGQYLGVGGDGIDEWCRDKSVVEIGAGPYPAIAAARRGWKRAVAVDPLAKGYAEEGMLPRVCDAITYIDAVGETVPLASQFADLVIIENCLDHVQDPAAVVREMHRLLRPGGLVWLFVDLSKYSDAMHPHPMSAERVLALMKEFELVKGGVTDIRAHPEAYGGYRGLWRKRGGGAQDGVVRTAAAEMVGAKG